MHVHLIGVAGTGMSALAALLVEAGHRVSGSDTAFDPPVGPYLRELGIECLPGWKVANLDGARSPCARPANRIDAHGAR